MIKYKALLSDIHCDSKYLIYILLVHLVLSNRVNTGFAVSIEEAAKAGKF